MEIRGEIRPVVISYKGEVARVVGEQLGRETKLRAELGSALLSEERRVWTPGVDLALFTESHGLADR